MIEVAAGFGIIVTVVVVGYVLARTGVADEVTRTTLSRLSFSAFTPCLLLTVLATADVRMLFSTVLLGSAVAATFACIVFALVALLAWRRAGSDVVIGSLAAGYVNGNNIGLPVATYVLGDPALVAPVMLFQIIVLTPIALGILEVRERADGPRWRRLIQPLVNPLIVASIVGTAISAFQLPIPEIVLEPFRLIGAAAVPAVLIAFGISLHGSRALAPGSSLREVALASGLKLIAMPVVAWLFGAFVLRLDAHLLYAVVALAALPTAQNVYTFAQRYGRGEVVARDTTLVTTVGSFPALLVIATVLVPPAA